MSRSCYLSSSLALFVILSGLGLVRVRPLLLSSQGSYVHFCPRPCSSTYRWAKLPTHHHKGTSLNEVRALTPRWPCSHRMWVIAKRLGSLHWLAHAVHQDMVIYFGATTSRRTSSKCSKRSPLKPGVRQQAILFPSDTAVLGLFQTVFHAPLGGTVSELSLFQLVRWSVPRRLQLSV